MKSAAEILKMNPDWWEKVGTSDFDGHTEFHRMTPEERLIWLSQVQRFYWAANGVRSNIGIPQTNVTTSCVLKR